MTVAPIPPTAKTLLKLERKSRKFESPSYRLLRWCPQSTCADLTLGLGEVVHDYLRQPSGETLRIKEIKSI